MSLTIDKTGSPIKITGTTNAKEVIFDNNVMVKFIYWLNPTTIGHLCVLKGKDSIKNGINKIRELLKQRRLKVHRSCVNLIWEFETYHYPLKKGFGNESELPIKENDHLLDALRYVILMDANSEEIKDYGYFYDVYKRADAPFSKDKPNPAL